jgi:hypothetical protein
MSVQSVSNALTPQQILQLLQQQQLSNADANESGTAVAETTPATGQNMPTGSDATADPSGGAATAAPKTLDPKTILALLQIQESQSMSQVNALFFGDQTPSTGSNDPFLSDAGSDSNPPTTDPLLAALNAQSDSSQTSLENILGVRGNMATSASTSGSLSATNDAVLKLLNSLGIGTSATTATSSAAATAAASSTDATES